MFLVTGHPRSGTSYTEQLLRETGLTIGGERFGRRRPLEAEPDVDGVVSWQHLPLYKGRFTTVFHQVRHPLNVISSSQTLYSGSYKTLFRYLDIPVKWYVHLYLRKIPLLFPETMLIRWSMYTWFHWNTRIERDARIEMRYKVENLPERWSEFLQNLEVPPREMPKLSSRVNTRRNRYKALKWEDLYEADEFLAEKIRQKARDYGYQAD